MSSQSRRRSDTMLNLVLARDGRSAQPPHDLGESGNHKLANFAQSCPRPGSDFRTRAASASVAANATREEPAGPTTSDRSSRPPPARAGAAPGPGIMMLRLPS
eukprot:2369137-Rhodomonas_salina.2